MSSLIEDIIDSAKRLIGIKKQLSEHEKHVSLHKALLESYNTYYALTPGTESDVKKTRPRAKSSSKATKRKSIPQTRSKKLKKLNKKAKSRVS